MKNTVSKKGQHGIALFRLTGDSTQWKAFKVKELYLACTMNHSPSGATIDVGKQ
jgi:hypothetical protein